MPTFRQTLTENIGKWTVINTKAGALHVKLESVNNKGVTVLLPNYYTVNDPSVQLIEENVNAEAEDVHAVQRFFRRRRRFFFRRFFFPFSFFLFPFLFI
ncbi:hypothetical protein [Aneurinibacillus aneurinilyticus]|jgi:hypothetical protein|nr:hypothetical protein [Aneurinibacillus aneurinilyticus]MCI1696566.1 hypothetical protein [Aneurinibacillus aneurinilyticus]MED0669626.1 hypothetical protein [Aneurinibacillus aneurinilyticus]MED0709347.1 hypothetical protein [Aneurinibacillus aneurinilyticus]MED0723958.1 hypothetical protein [Aneurinibacillus aneurinilyticus]MED0735067.1 hypothetical protein [Aneurinibacillus aneurinilyticus]